jgi:hypothetical protein
MYAQGVPGVRKSLSECIRQVHVADLSAFSGLVIKAQRIMQQPLNVLRRQLIA